MDIDQPGKDEDDHLSPNLSAAFSNPACTDTCLDRILVDGDRCMGACKEAISPTIILPSSPASEVCGNMDICIPDTFCDGGEPRKKDDEADKEKEDENGTGNGTITEEDADDAGQAECPIRQNNLNAPSIDIEIPLADIFRDKIQVPDEEQESHTSSPPLLSVSDAHNKYPSLTTPPSSPELPITSSPSPSPSPSPTKKYPFTPPGWAFPYTNAYIATLPLSSAVLETSGRMWVNRHFQGPCVQRWVVDYEAVARVLGRRGGG